MPPELPDIYVPPKKYSADLEVKESFLGFFVISKPDAQHYEDLVLKTLEDLGLDFALCRG